MPTIFLGKKPEWYKQKTATMTHQELINKWQLEVERLQRLSLSIVHHNRMANIVLTDKHEALLEQATLIYMELCQMDTKEPITLTSTSLPTGCMYSGKPMEGKELAILQETSKRIISDKPTTLRK